MNIRLCAPWSLALPLLLVWPVRAVEFLDTGDPDHNVSTPGDNSGWQYVGTFNTVSDTRTLGVPIAPLYFISAAHIAGAVGDHLAFHGEIHLVTEAHNIAGTDLRVFKVDESKPFKSWAPLVSSAPGNGSLITTIGRGTDRGAEVIVGSMLKGWKNGSVNNRQRWGRNLITNHLDDPTYGRLFYCDFNNPGIADECHLTTGDSGGGTFVLEGGLWKLAGVNLGVDGRFRRNNSEVPYPAALFDAGGLEIETSPGQFVAIAEDDEDIPSSFYCSDVFDSLSAINTITGRTSVLGPENYAAWQTLYFTPAQIAAPATTGPLGDFDADGIANLLEFTLNLDPTYPGQVTMEAGSGIRGLPLVAVENVGGVDKVTIEFVRRTTESGSGITCEARFSSDLGTWVAGDTETVNPINERWERVKVADLAPASGNAVRFGRVEVVMP